jgi:hypothetical protein
MRRRNLGIKSEVELCHTIRPLFEADGSTLYPEIQGIDYLAVKGETYIAIEVKTTMCAKVVEQAWDRLNSGLVNGATICVPYEHFVSANNMFWREVCTKLSVGIITYRNGKLLTEVPMSLRPREKEDLTALLRPEALQHTQAGMPSCKRWGELDVIQCKYVDYIKNVDGYLYCNQDRFSLDLAIAAVQPEFVGKRGKVLQKGRDYVAALIYWNRWSKLGLDNGKLFLK